MMQVVEAERRFNALFRDTYAAVRRYANHRGLTGADADDLVADVFTVAWRKLDHVPDDDPIPWLFAVARNHWRNHIRKHARERDVIARMVFDDHVAEPDLADVTSDDLRRALARLPDVDQEILKLVVWDGLGPHQAAVVLECTPNAARVRLHRARNRLASELETPHRLATEHQQKEVHDG
jgi:RNA polymerase sigma-70 factor (ECF subfamily)